MENQVLMIWNIYKTTKVDKEDKEIQVGSLINAMVYRLTAHIRHEKSLMGILFLNVM